MLVKLSPCGDHPSKAGLFASPSTAARARKECRFRRPFSASTLSNRRVISLRTGDEAARPSYSGGQDMQDQPLTIAGRSHPERIVGFRCMTQAHRRPSASSMASSLADRARRAVEAPPRLVGNRGALNGSRTRTLWPSPSQCRGDPCPVWPRDRGRFPWGRSTRPIRATAQRIRQQRCEFSTARTADR